MAAVDSKMLDLDDFDVIDDTSLAAKDNKKYPENQQGLVDMARDVAKAQSLLFDLIILKDRLQARKDRLAPKEYVRIFLYTDGDTAYDVPLVNGKLNVADLQRIDKDILSIIYKNPQNGRIRLLMADKEGQISAPEGGWKAHPFFAWFQN
ncbi:hypothetical protein QR680_003990 [Steinernema hermaphroditum]|uniref:TAR DNA-binding protein 43 N-terminal domain-containing protein n=1 Tax=Steinernema hermaphroditum TaxID=289476 RepID=A0AA39HPK3_9BILA|nr:hypothetical protein QR680_003990 [Steinernema hermaphroditum]